LTSKIGLELRKRNVKAMAWGVTMYRAETWTITKIIKRR